MTTLRLYDNSRLSDYKRCPRYFYYRHVLGWVRDGDALALVFGSAWHKAMEVVWPALIDKRPHAQALTEAVDAFILEWKANGLPFPLDYETEEQYSPRTPGNALEMLAVYIESRHKLLESGDLELVSVERPFAVPLDPDDPTLFYVGKIDKEVRVARNGRIRAIEHKTTTAYSKQAKFRASFIDSFSPNSQIDGYLYKLHMTSPGAVDGVWVDAALVHKTEQAFKFIPVEKKMDQLDAWLWETRSWIDQIEAHKVRLASTGSQDRYLPAFPKNTNSCHDFNKSCQFIDLCKAWANPIGKELPPGYRLEPWDPLERIDAEKLELPISG